MYESKLFELLKTFNKKELKRFDAFVRSPYFNKHRETLSLWKILRKYAPEFSHKNLEKTQLFTLLYGGQPFNPQWLYDLTAYLTRLAEQFLAAENFWQHPLRSQQHLLAALAQKRLDARWKKQYAVLAKKTAADYSQTTDIWIEKYILSKLQIYHHDDYAHRKGFKNFDITVHRQAFTNLTTLYVIDALANQSYLLSHHLSRGLSFNPIFLETFFEPLFAAMQPADAYMARSFHRSLLLSLKGSDEQLGHLLEAVSQASFEQIPARMQRSILTNMGNYCHKNLPGNEPFYRNHLQVIYNRFIGLNLLVVNGYFLAVPFGNIVYNALQLGKLDWAKEFINTYSEQLDPDIQTSLTSFCRANYQFELGNFEEALLQLHQSNVFWSQNKASHKNLLIRIYYELGETIALISQVDALKHYLQEAKQLSMAQKAANLAFVNFAIQLVRLKNSHKPMKSLTALETKIEQSGSIHKKWLLQKINELVLVKR